MKLLLEYNLLFACYGAIKTIKSCEKQLTEVLSSQTKIFIEEGFLPKISDIDIIIEKPTIDVFTPEENKFVDFKRAAIGIKIDGNNGRYKQHEILNSDDFTPLKYFGLQDWVVLPDRWRYIFYETINNMIDVSPFLVLFLHEIGQYYWQWINDCNGIKSEILDIIEDGNKNISECKTIRATMQQILITHKQVSVYTENLVDTLKDIAVKRGMLKCASDMKKVVVGWKIGDLTRSNDWFLDNFGDFDINSDVITSPYAKLHGMLNTEGELVL